MVNVAISRKRFAVVAIGICLLAALIAVPAYAFYYVHGDYDVDSDVKGAIEVFCTVDTSAQGGTIWSGLLFVPADSTVETALEEALHSSEDHNGIEAIHDHSVSSDAEFIKGEGGKWTVKVYHAESQKPGTHTTQDGEGETVAMSDLGSVNLQRFDQVVATLEA